MLHASVCHSWHWSLYRGLGVRLIQAQFPSLARVGHVQGETRMFTDVLVPDPCKSWPSTHAWKRAPLSADGAAVSAAGHLSLSNYGSGLLLPACWWVMERASGGEQWTGQHGVICGPGAPSSARAHLSCWGRGRQRRRAGGWGLRSTSRSRAENCRDYFPFYVVLRSLNFGWDGLLFCLSAVSVRMCWSVDFRLR